MLHSLNNLHEYKDLSLLHEQLHVLLFHPSNKCFLNYGNNLLPN